MSSTKLQIGLPGHSAPGVGFEAPFEMLDACHERVERMLRLLGKIREHVQTHGADTQARDAARDVMRYFDQAGPHHHEDEERHVFPPLRAQRDPAVLAVVIRINRRLSSEISRRIALEQELRSSEYHYRGLVESLSAIAWEADANDFTYSYVSPHAEDLLTLARFAFERGEAIAADQAAPVYLRDKVALTKAERGVI